jgi:cbb3-type cytochrome oxidase subunit 3
MALLALSEQTAVAVVAAAGIVIGFVVLGIVAWIFWRAAKRDRDEGR